MLRSEFEKWSIGLFQDFDRGIWVPIISSVTALELKDAPAQVQEFFEAFCDKKPELLTPTTEAFELMEQYAQRGILKPRFQTDMLHIALATLGKVDVLVS